MNRDAMREKIEAFAELQEGWDSYGGRPIGPKTIAAALELLSALPPRYVHVLPVNDGSIQFEDMSGDNLIEVWANDND